MTAPPRIHLPPGVRESMVGQVAKEDPLGRSRYAGLLERTAAELRALERVAAREYRRQAKRTHKGATPARQRRAADKALRAAVDSAWMAGLARALEIEDAARADGPQARLGHVMTVKAIEEARQRALNQVDKESDAALRAAERT